MGYRIEYQGKVFCTCYDHEPFSNLFEGDPINEEEGELAARENNEMIVNQLTETRDNISSVSIDEEMTNLIKYQHAYAAAAKLIATADEMLRTLLEVK